MTDLPTVKSQEFELRQREAKALQSSSFMPQKFRQNLADCLAVVEIAKRVGVSASVAAQNIQEVYGIIGWKSTFVISMINSCGKFSDLRFDVRGEGMDMACRAWAIDSVTKEKVQGPKVTMQMAKAEGWLDKNGSKWKTMPELMIQYRAAAFFGRLYVPEILNGIYMADEIPDFVTPPEKDITPPKTKGVSSEDILAELEKQPHEPFFEKK